MDGPRATLAAVAEAAGVSVPTASKVLNGRTDVAAETRARVEKVVARLGYRKPAAARRRPRKAVTMLDLVINELDSSWAVEILSGTEKVAQEAGMSIALTAVHSNSTLTRKWLDSLALRGCRGAILVLSDLSGYQRAELARQEIPFVVVDAVGQPDESVPSVGATNWHGGFAATQHLIEHGHRRIAVIGGPQQLMCTRARIAGYRAALDTAGLPLHPPYVRYGDFRHQQGYEQTRELLKLPDPPTAIFAGSDLQALGAYQAMHESRLRVPDDVSIVGFDDLPFAPWTAPPLTTVRQPLQEMGALAARMLLSLIRGEPLGARRAELATNLIVRGSTGPAHCGH
ncbi:LacI family DNA-binding transcriptional regulator [Amycolatopsis sp. OK19-0408]|uniref:LacI family DNA-binding transcriptional regulator n=1 Tax=Amycolatopsis iheyensis TaxID=2945988 RepID=A0A9X2SRA7_9PSEU|nr:LacI family DNA-binding transcriptional regulator [Amycolatopsis iheyensis]MCR6489775.1 LacI family DNA-binding transcriptional regulator [Amycolatopsis iheyensis]